VLAGLSAEFGERLVIASLDSDDNPRATQTYRVMAMPTLVFFRDGEVVGSIVGSRPASVLRQAFTELLDAGPDGGLRG
jgi:thioredoxin 1